MAHEDQTDSNIGPKKTQWNDTETNAFIDYLITNRSKMGATSFKLETFNKATSTLGAMDIRTHGPIKTGVHCRTKYNLVRCFTPPLFPPLMYWSFKFSSRLHSTLSINTAINLAFTRMLRLVLTFKGPLLKKLGHLILPIRYMNIARPLNTILTFSTDKFGHEAVQKWVEILS